MLLAILSLLLSARASATTVIVLRAGEDIILAADSKSSQYKRGEVTVVNVCKLFKVTHRIDRRSIWIAFVGPTNAKSRARVMAIARECPGNISACARAIFSAASEALADGFSNVPPGTPTAGTIIAIDSLAIHVINFGGLLDIGQPISFDISRGDVALIEGTADEARSVFKKEPQSFRNLKNMIASTRRMLEAQSKVTPAHVGPPFNIVRLTRSGHEWIQRNGCPE